MVMITKKKVLPSEPEVVAPVAPVAATPPPEPKKLVGAVKGSRVLISIKPSEAKAMVSIGGVTHKVVYHTRNGAPMIGVPGGPSVPVESWLAGQADLKGLQA